MFHRRPWPSCCKTPTISARQLLTTLPPTIIEGKMYSQNSYILNLATGVLARIGIVLAILCGSGLVFAQEVGDTIRVNTRVVFLDALVKDKRTGVPISDLKPENFEILDENNSRPISYFTREGQARKPLTLVLILDLREDGAGRFLRRPEVLKTMADELTKLSP